MDTRYLFKRHNTWWVKVAVPRTLREELGFDLRASLKTHSLTEAQEKRWNIVDNLKGEIEGVKNKRKADISVGERNKVCLPCSYSSS